MEVLRDRGYKIRVLTKTPVDWTRIRAWNPGAPRPDAEKEFERLDLRFFGKYQKLLATRSVRGLGSSLFFNTSGDFFPFLYETNSVNITYCHFPVVRRISEKDYPTRYKRLPWSAYFRAYAYLLNRAIENAMHVVLLLTNSEFSRQRIKEFLGAESQVIYPPVDVERFQTMLTTEHQPHRIVTISRFDPSKDLDVVIDIAANLPRTMRWDVIGTLSSANAGYFARLKSRIASLGLAEIVQLHPNASEDGIRNLISRGGIYFHPKRGEHFGISIVEGMAAGLVPIVWDYGGACEYVPRRWQFSRVDDVIGLVDEAKAVTDDERRALSESTSRFSQSHFKEQIGKAIDRAYQTNHEPPARHVSLRLPATDEPAMTNPPH